MYMVLKVLIVKSKAVIRIIFFSVKCKWLAPIPFEFSAEIFA